MPEKISMRLVFHQQHYDGTQDTLDLLLVIADECIEDY